MDEAIMQAEEGTRESDSLSRLRQSQQKSHLFAETSQKMVDLVEKGDRKGLELLCHQRPSFLISDA